jgi:hypothetical protein
MGARFAVGSAVIVVCLLLSALPASASSPADQASAAEDAAQGASNRAQKQPAQERPDVVRVGVLINDIQQLDLQSHSYNVDMYMWFKWRNPEIDPSRSFEFLNAFQLWGHIITYSTGKPERLPNGDYYQALRNQGQFNNKLPLERYPFDTQHLVVNIEDSSLNMRDLVFVPDRIPVALSDDLSIPGWDVGTPRLRIVNNRYDTDFGYPSTEDAAYSRIIVDLPVSRPAFTYAMKLLLPMLLVALTAALSLSVHPRYVEGRIGIGITALLTLVALQLTNNSSLPDVNYLILLDKLYIASYAFVVLTMAIIVKNSWVDASGDISAAVRADRRGLTFLTVSYFAVTGLILLLTLT